MKSWNIIYIFFNKTEFGRNTLTNPNAWSYFSPLMSSLEWTFTRLKSVVLLDHSHQVGRNRYMASPFNDILVPKTSKSHRIVEHKIHAEASGGEIFEVYVSYKVVKTSKSKSFVWMNGQSNGLILAVKPNCLWKHHSHQVSQCLSISSQ